MNPEFAERAFTAPEARVARFTGTVIRQLRLAQTPLDRQLRVLEIGCGTGRQCLALAEALPQADILGLDISAPNIQAAKSQAAQHPAATRLRFELVDYLAASPGSFDLILADSVFHLLGAPAEAIFPKVAGELAEGGLLIMTLPGGDAYNSLLWCVRRACRLLRCRALDSAIMLAARLLHHGAYTTEELRERLPYMFILPPFQDGATLRGLLAAQGLRLRHEEPVPHGSLAQPKHRLLVCAKAKP